MPYLAHFALASHPFGLTPNTEQYFPTANNTHILQSLTYATAKRGGILKVVGDVGTGKTMLCRLLLRGLMDDPGTRGGVAYLNAPQADGQWLLAALCMEFGLSGSGNRAELMHRLNQVLVEAHADGRTCVVVVDEAQALGPEGLETIRLLSNLETETAKLLQIVLFGQPELDVLLARPDLRQINQRIAFAFTTRPLSAPEVAAYVQHRLRCARLAGVEFPVFTATALELLALASRGVPRVVNILADKALLIAYGDSAMPVTEDHVRSAIDDSRAIVGDVPRLRRPRRTGGGWGRRVLWGTLAAEAAVVAGVLVYNPDLPARALDLITGHAAVAGPVVAEPAQTVVAEPARTVVAEPAPAVVAEPAPTVVAEPAAMAAPAPAAVPPVASAAVVPAPVEPVPQPAAPAPEQATLPAEPVSAAPPPVLPAPQPAVQAIEQAALPTEPAPAPAATEAAPPVPPVVPSSLAAQPAAEATSPPSAGPAVPLPDVKPRPPATASLTAGARIQLMSAPADEDTLIGRRMPDGTWRWE